MDKEKPSPESAFRDLAFYSHGLASFAKGRDEAGADFFSAHLFKTFQNDEDEEGGKQTDAGEHAPNHGERSTPHQ